MLCLPKSIMRNLSQPAFRVLLVDLAADPRDVVGQPPGGVVGGELADVADPPDVVADAVAVAVGPLQRPARDLLAHRDRLAHRAVAEAAAAHVVHLAGARRPEEMVEGADEV